MLLMLNVNILNTNMNIRKFLTALTLCVLVFCGTVSAQIRPFRFAQITDIHLNPNNPNPTEWLLRSVAQINATDSLDFVLVTGDIADYGDRKTIEKVKTCLDLLKYKYYIILGNHETTWSDSGCMAFSETFGSERFEFVHNGILFLGFNTGPFMRMAYGHVVPQDITWLKQRMDKWGKDKPVILVTHYPLTKGDVDNWYDVTDAIRPYNIRLMIGGHYHQNRNLRYDGIPGILMRSNLADENGKPGYGIYDVTADSIKVYTQNIGAPRKEWATFSLKDNLFDHNGKAEEYPDYSVNKQFGAKEKWCVKGEAGVYSSPFKEGKRLLVGDDMGKLKAYNINNGKLLWQFSAGKRIVGDCAAADGIVVFGSADSTVYGLNSADGKMIWKLKTQGPVLGAVRIDNGVAYVGASDHKFRAIDIKTGKLVWEYANVTGYIVARPLVVAGKVIFGAWDNTLYALNTNDGSEAWKWKGGKDGMHFSPASVWPVCSGGRVFIAAPDRYLTAIDLNTGKTIWRTNASVVRESIGLSADGTMVYGKTMNDSVVSFSTVGDTPKEIWSSNVGFGYEHAPSMPLESNGTVFGGTCSGLVYAVDAKTGALKWKYKIGNSLVNTVLPLSAKEVAVTSSDGTVAVITSK